MGTYAMDIIAGYDFRQDMTRLRSQLLGELRSAHRPNINDEMQRVECVVSTVRAYLQKIADNAGRIEEMRKRPSQYAQCA